MAERLFVYGTLHPDRAPAEIAQVVRGMEPLGEGVIRGRMHRFREYPAVKIDSKNGSRIKGEVFTLPNPGVLEKLDAYEEFYPAKLAESLFLRKQVKVRLQDGTRVDCWVYEYNRRLPRTRQGRRPPAGPAQKQVAAALA